MVKVASHDPRNTPKEGNFSLNLLKNSGIKFSSGLIGNIIGSS